LMAKSEIEEDLVRLAYLQAKMERHPVTGDTLYESMIEEPRLKSAPREFSYTDFAGGLGTKVYKYLNRLKDDDRHRTIAYLREMLESLETQ